MDKSKIKTAARKALIAADPDYYSWPEKQQEQFRATMDDAAQNRVEAVLLKSLLGIQCTAKNAGEIWRTSRYQNWITSTGHNYSLQA